MSQPGESDCSGIVVDPGRPASYAISTMSLQAGPFGFIDSWERLAERLALPVDVLDGALDWSQDPRHYELRTTYIKGRPRKLYIPHDHLRAVLRVVGELLQPFSLGLDQSSRGFRPGGSTYLNALPHCGKLWLQKLDIKSFYSSTTTSMIRRQFISRGLPEDVAQKLATLVTFRGSLVLGPSPSPTIANLQLEDFDRDIAVAVLQSKVTFTRYADDMTLSSDQAFDFSEMIGSRLAEEGYELNPAKSRIARRGASIRVTGLSVDRSDGPRLPKRFKRRLRQEFYYASRYGFEDHAQRRYSWGWIDPFEEEWKHYSHSFKHFQGMVRYALSIEPAWTKALLEKYPNVIPRVSADEHPRVRRRRSLEKLAVAIRERGEQMAPRFDGDGSEVRG